MTSARASMTRRATQWGSAGALAAVSLVAVLVTSKAQPKIPLVPVDAPLVAADAALSTAMRSADRGAARHLLALQFTFVDADGKIHHRKEVLGDLKAVGGAERIDPTVRSYGLLGTVIGQRKSGQDGELFFFDIWAKQKHAWRALMMQDVPPESAEPAAVVAAAPPPTTVQAAVAAPFECKNPCQAIPYRVRSAAEQEVINAFQALESAAAAHDAEGWAKHVADDFMLYGSGRAPIPKSGRVAMIAQQKQREAIPASPGEVESMQLEVYGDAAAMISTHSRPGNPRSSYRSACIWAKRNGQWQMVIGAQTDIK